MSIKALFDICVEKIYKLNDYIIKKGDPKHSKFFFFFYMLWSIFFQNKGIYLIKKGDVEIRKNLLINEKK